MEGGEAGQGRFLSTGCNFDSLYSCSLSQAIGLIDPLDGLIMV